MCLMTKQVREKFNKLNEKSGFIQSLIINFGFKQHFIEYTREKRTTGSSKWRNYRKLSKMAVEMLATTSNFPINFLLFFGTLGSLFSSIKFIYTMFFNYSEIRILIDLLVFFMFFFSFVTGWLGVYIYNILSEVRNRPLFYVWDQKNLSEKQIEIYKKL